MILETTLIMMNMRKKQKENFAEDASKEKIVWTWFDVIYMFLGITWAIMFVALWLRIVYLAFSCSFGEGVASMLLSSHYSLYKFGDLIKVSCNVY